MGLTVQERSVVRALGQALFPRDRSVDLDGEDVDVERWVEDYLDRMPMGARSQIRALLATFDLGFGAWALRPGARFVNGRPEQQSDYIASWTQSSTYVQRMLFEGLWCVMAFAYVEQAEALGHIAAGVPAPSPDGPAQSVPAPVQEKA